jgi:hypothetical protein
MEILATIEHVEEPVVQKDTVVIIVNAPSSTAGTSTGSTATGAAAPAAGTAASPATAPTPTPVQASPLLVGDLVLAQFEVDDFYHKRYLPSKVQTIPSEATKWQTQLIAVTDETPENTWTTDILSKWHKASSNELRDGTVVIYTDYEPVATSVWYPGVVVMTDELFKGIVSIKGRWGDIHKVEVSKISIVDAPILRIP